MQKHFTEVIDLIKNARTKAFKAVNTELINLYWQIGKYISERTAKEGWGKSTVLQLAEYIAKNEPGLKGYSDKNLWRMKQFFETFSDNEKLATLCREITWSHNRLVMPLKTSEERRFYIQLSIREKLSVRELERQINSSLFERTMLSAQKLAPLVRVLPNDIEHTFKETYVLEFLNLPEKHTEADLQKQLIARMKNFILELGKDFLFVDEEYRLQVGNRDFKSDLLFYHRNLQCLVAFELKTTQFEPEHLGKLNFYLEALDRDVKKPHENPSIGVLLCKSKDEEVVEYALSRSMSPTMISQYTLALPDKKLLQAKLNEFYEMWQEEKEDE